MLVKMNSDTTLIHVYLMPGMAASPDIFEYIKLPSETFKMHLLSWKMPIKNESLQEYTGRILKEITHKNPVLIGVSFGGIIVQEMAKLIPYKRLILISTVKTKYELPNRMRLLKQTSLYRILPMGLARHVTKLDKFPIGKFAHKRIEIYKKYMSMEDKRYLSWALKQVLFWSQKEPIEGCIHIQGDKDIVFPIRHIKNCIVVPNGTHVMIINRFRWFNENLPSLILNGKLEE